ncbi:MAG: hypothetical protein HFH68_14325 [Lachnospiraceae bacterium]|nr:hypothetical protein [Lachnospiraceae bacterium]
MTLLYGIFLSYFLSFSEVNSKNKANSNIQHLKNNEPPKLQMQQENDTEVETSETQTIGGIKNTIEKGNQANNITIIPADNFKDMLKIQKIIYDFADAYFKGDIDTVKQYMENPDKADVYKNNNKEGIYISCLKGLDDLQAGKQVHKITSSLEFLTSEMPDSYTYLTINLVRIKNSWKISWYGLEL